MPESEPRTVHQVLDALHGELLPLLAAAIQDLEELDVEEGTLATAALSKLRRGYGLARDELVATHPDRAEQSAADALRAVAALALEQTGVYVTVHAPEFCRIAHQRTLVLIAGELLRNVGAHARARACDVHLQTDARWVGLVVNDDGCGVSPERLAARPGRWASRRAEHAQACRGRLGAHQLAAGDRRRHDRPGVPADRTGRSTCITRAVHPLSGEA